MNILEIKDKLKQLKHQKKLIYGMGEKRLPYKTIKKIPDAEFNMSIFFRMIKALGCIFMADGQLIPSMVDLGYYLASKRSSQNITQFDIVKKTGLTPQRIVSIEKGNNYRFSTLVRYLSAFENDFINFEIV